jgi:uridine phosphorylase
MRVPVEEPGGADAPEDAFDKLAHRSSLLRARGAVKPPGTYRDREKRSNAAVGDDPRAIHIHPTAPLAERVLLPGDPGRALALAQELLERPLMFNHNRGLWGYTGNAADGEALTIQSTGMGGPSAAIVLEELIALGATRAVRVGTAGALDPTLGAGERVRADAALLAALQAAAPRVRCGPIVSSDLFYEVGEPRFDAWREAGALAVEMEAATLFAVGTLRGIQVACALAVTDVLTAQRERIDNDALTEAGLAVGRLGLSALL